MVLPYNRPPPLQPLADLRLRSHWSVLTAASCVAFFALFWREGISAAGRGNIFIVVERSGNRIRWSRELVGWYGVRSKGDMT